jgi:SAM-dependent methyltransferase
MVTESNEKIRETVRRGYAKVAKTGSGCCGPKSSCCGGINTAKNISEKIGYTEEEMQNVPEGANLGLGCGNPIALALLKQGETVLDLGSGAGFDCFLAANKVGPGGKVIGVDMTAEMVEKANENARKGHYANVEFRLGEIESLPVEDNAVDVVISNCVINLVPDKSVAFKEAYRVLKPGGRLMVSDVVLLKPLPESIQNSVEAYIGCLSGAMMKDNYLKVISKAGFKNVKILEENAFPLDVMANDPTAKAILDTPKVSAEDIKSAENSVASIKVSATK